MQKKRNNVWIEVIKNGVPIWHTPAMKQIEVHIDRETSSVFIRIWCEKTTNKFIYVFYMNFLSSEISRH